MVRRALRKQQFQHITKLLSETCAAMQDCVPYSGIPGRRRGRMNERIEGPAGGSASQFNGNVFESPGPSLASNSMDRRSPLCLVVEDDSTMRHLVTNYLEDHDIRAISASRREEVAGRLARNQPDLVVLDLRLGQDDGLDLLREIRATSDVPVIITTGHRRDEIDRVVGLELGADDYLTKPFSLRELLARIRAVLRRRGGVNAGPQRDSEQGRCRF